MASVVVMPKQGNTVESCIILEWKKQVGDAVSEGDILCEAETDKATIEVESTASGTVLKLLYDVDDEVPVQQPIAVIGEEGEDISSLVSDEPQKSEAEAEETKQEEPKQPAEEKSEAPAQPVQGDRPQGSSPRARGTAQKMGVDVSRLAGSGPGGRIIERDVLASSPGEPMTPAAAQKAASEGLQAPVSGSGIGGRVRLEDLTAGDRAQLQDKPLSDGVKDVPVKGIRKITASRMLASIQNTCQLTLTASADASALLAFRKRCKESDESLGMRNITINDMILLAAVRTLADFPYVNSHFLGNVIQEFEHVHIGMAVDTPRGLMVPVVKYADLRSLPQISQEAKRLITACNEGKVSPDDLEGGTFTVTNLGALGIEHFTPVLNTPQTAILGVNTITKRPAEEGDSIVLKPYIGFSLTFDHQAFDGAPAARFLQAFVRAVESIDLTAAR